jgi:hypothetical protein
LRSLSLHIYYQSGVVFENGFRLLLFTCTDHKTPLQEDYATKHNVSEEDRMAVEDDSTKSADPMQGLEGLDQAGPKLA